VRFHLIERSQRHLELGRLERFQKAGRHCGIHPIPAHGLTAINAEMEMGDVTLIARGDPIGQVFYLHPPPTLATDDDPLQERGAFSHRAWLLVKVAGSVAVQARLVAEKLVPTDVARMGILEDNGPVSPFTLVHLHLHRRPICGLDPRLLAPPEDIRASVERIMEDGEHAPVLEWFPAQFALAPRLAAAARKAEPFAAEVAQHCHRRAMVLEQGKNEPYGVLDLLVRIQHDVPERIMDQANGQREAQLALLGFRHRAALHALPQPMEFGLRHRPLEAEQQAIIVVRGIIDAFLVNDQGVGQGADFQQPVPVTTGAGQAGGFETEHSAGVPQAHFGHEPLEAIAPDGGGARMGLVLVDHADLVACPA
jgi:hypothetical protein